MTFMQGKDRYAQKRLLKLRPKNIYSPASPPRHGLSMLFNVSKIRGVWRHSFPENFEILSPRKRDFRYEFIAFKIDCVFIVYFYKFLLTLAVLI